MAERGPEDAYEKQYMKGDDAVLHRDKLVWKYHYLLSLPLLLSLLASVAAFAGLGSKPAPLSAAFVSLIPTVILGLVWVLFSVLRVHVTKKELVIQLGPFGPRIPIRAIRDVKVTGYDLAKFGGWGIRRSFDGTWAYSMAGQSKEVVEVAYEESGELKRVVMSASDPPALAAAIQRARGAGGVRIAGAAAEDAVDRDALAEAEAAAEQEASDDRKASR